MVPDDLTDLTGFPLSEARERLAARGVAIVGETEVSPPWSATGEGMVRVIRITPEGAGVRLFVAHRTYRRPERPNANSKA